VANGSFLVSQASRMRIRPMDRQPCRGFYGYLTAVVDPLAGPGHRFRGTCRSAGSQLKVGCMDFRWRTRQRPKSETSCTVSLPTLAVRWIKVRANLAKGGPHRLATSSGNGRSSEGTASTASAIATFSEAIAASSSLTDSWCGGRTRALSVWGVPASDTAGSGSDWGLNVASSTTELSTT